METLLFVHGWHARGSVWNALAAAFAERYRCIAPDLRGFGDAAGTAGPFTVEQGSADMLALLDDAGIDRAVLVGHSMGGTIVQRFAVDHPTRVRALVLISPVPASGLTLSNEARVYFRATAGDPTATQHFLDALAFGGTFPSAVNALLLASANAESPVAARAWFDSWSNQDFVEEARGISAPTLVIAPTHDRPMTPKFLRERVVEVIPKSRMIVIQNTAHYPHLEKHDECARAIAQFLQEIGPI